MLPSAQFWKCANSWRRNWRNRYQFESRLVFGFQTIIQRGNLGYWHETDVPTALLNVCFQGQSGKHLLALSFSGFDPQETSVVSVERTMGWVWHSLALKTSTV